MWIFKWTLISLMLLGSSAICFGQTDSTINSLGIIQPKYLDQINTKIVKYSNRLTGKTEKTLRKLSRWEYRIHSVLQKADPLAAERLFGSQTLTFSSMLQKVVEGKELAENYKAQYDEYRDKLTTGIKFMAVQKDKLDKSLLEPLRQASLKMNELENRVTEFEAITKLIKERKQQLVDASIKVIAKSKYLKKIDKETFYYIETLRNYKEIFSDPKKLEIVALNILHKIPLFTKFISENSMLNSLFGTPADQINPQNFVGLQTRANTNALIQQGIGAGGPNAASAVTQNMQVAQAELAKLKDKIIKASGSPTVTEIPNFKPNLQKTKTFKQRLDYNANINISKPGTFQPNTADVAMGVGYHLNDKSIIGVAASYKIGFGSIKKIAFSGEGLGLRSFIDWKIKKNLFVTGGYELDYNAAYRHIPTMESLSTWRPSGLLGMTKEIKLKTKLFKATKLQLLYNMLHYQVPATQPVIFRIGYNF